MSNARKLFRLFKSLMEYKKINAILGKADSVSLRKLILQLIPRIAFFFFWFFDHLIVIHKVNFYRGYDLKWVLQCWGKLWFIANTTQIIDGILDLISLSKEEAKLAAQKRVQQSNGVNYEPDDIKAKEREIRQKKKACKLTIIKCCGDNITATQTIGWPKQFFGWEFHDGWIGVGGCTSALISCYNAYPASKKC